MPNSVRYKALCLRLVLLASVASIACAHSHTGRQQAVSDVAYPPWVLAGSGAQAEGGQRTLVGVGQISGMRNVALARATADNRARAELARILNAYVSTLIVQSAVSSSATNKGKQNDDALTKTIFAAVLPSVQVVDHWFHPDRGAVFSLARLEIDDVHDAIARIRDLPEPTVSALLANLEPVHAGMLALNPKQPG